MLHQMVPLFIMWDSKYVSPYIGGVGVGRASERVYGLYTYENVDNYGWLLNNLNFTL